MMKERNKMLLKVSGLLLAVFVLGSLTGAAIDGIYRARAAGMESRSLSMRDSEAYFDTLQRELKLNANQATGIRLILDHTRNEYKGICAETRPRYDALRGQARIQMRALLLPAQQQRFDEIVTQENCNCPDPRK
jgi:hypothetical protein